jgi:predicted secreted protein
VNLPIPTLVIIYITLWWIVLFAILPLGAKSHAEAGVEVGDGGDPGAPLVPNLKRKAITTTWVTAIIFALLIWVIESGVVQLPLIPSQ